MTEDPRVSVVMCAYNGIGVIEQAVGDIFAQEFDDWELVISDDGSSDGTRDYLAGLNDPRVRVILRDSNVGYVRNKNAAIAAARGKYITQQDQDDRTHPQRLSIMLDGLQRTDLAIAGCGYRTVGVDGQLLFETELDRETVIHGHDVTRPYPFWYPALLVRREVYAEIGLFEEFFAGAFGDDLYWTAKANARYPILCLPDRLYDYVESVGSITSLAGSNRKLIMGEVLDHLLQQRRQTGTDDLELGRVGRLEATFLSDRELLAGKLQVYAARAIDQARWADASRLIRRAFYLSPMRPALARTALYYCRAFLRECKSGFRNS